MNVDNVEWRKFCEPCKSWCCKGEEPYASKEELKVLSVEKIGRKEDESCVFLGKKGECLVYEHRPFECRIFPYDIVKQNGQLLWIVWNVCPASPHLNHEIMCAYFEQEFAQKWSYEYIEAYVRHHALYQPQKYSVQSFQVVRALKYKRTT